MTVELKERGRALLLDGHSAAGIEVLQSLGRAGVEVDVASEVVDCLGFVSRYASRRLHQPGAADPDTFLPWLRDLDRERHYSLISATTENSLIAVNGLPMRDPLRAKALLPSPEALEVALSKEMTWRLARHLGLRVPRSRLLSSIDDATDEMGFPVVLKPVRSLIAVSGGTEGLVPVIARDEREKRSALARLLKKSLVQEQMYVAGRGLGVECLYDHGQMVWFFVHERVHEVPLTGGGSSYRKSVAPQTEAVQFAKRLLDDLNWNGVAMVEFRKEPDGAACLMEINPRLWGSLALAIDAGVDFPLGMWRLARGEQPGPQPRYRVPYYTRHIARDLAWLRENWRADHCDPLLLTRPRLQSLLEYMRPLLLRESWDHFDVRDLRVFTRQLQGILHDDLGGASVRLVRSWRLERRMRAQHRRLIRGIRTGDIAVSRILFVCYGNICRSPFAERYASQAIPNVESLSAGFHAAVDRESPVHLIRAAHILGVRLDGWRSKTIDAELVESADLILTMDVQNYLMLEEHFPKAKHRALPLAAFDPEGGINIDDPYMLDETETLRILTRIRRAIDGLENMLSSSRRLPHG